MEDVPERPGRGGSLRLSGTPPVQRLESRPRRPCEFWPSEGGKFRDPASYIPAFSGVKPSPKSSAMSWKPTL